MTRLLLSVLLAGAALGATACSKSSSAATTTAPSSVTTTSSTEFFTGSISPKASAFYSFTVTTPGDVTVTLASTTTARIGPASTARLSLAMGVPSGFGCATLSSVETGAGLSAQLIAPGAANSIYCINVADPGSLAGDVNFVIRIVHT